MPEMTILLNGDNAWPDLRDKPILEGDDRKPIQLAALPAGMVSGKASVSIRIETTDGQTVVGQTSVACFLAAATALRARFGENA